MQDFDTLRHRVEETAERLSLAQSERQDETQSLISILRDLEEKYATQEQQFAYYRERLEPLERSNAQLTSLVENLLELIDRGFGDGSIDPLRQASQMASAMLQTDIKPLDGGAVDHEEDPVGDASSESDNEASAMENADIDDAVAEAEPQMATLDDVDDGDLSGIETQAAEEPEEDVQVIEDLIELVEDDTGIDSDEPVAPYEDEQGFAEPVESHMDDVTDFELEEVPLAYLEDDIDVASDNIGTDIDAIAAMELGDAVAEDQDAPAEAFAESDMPSPVDMVSDDEMVASQDLPQAEDPDQAVRFEDVSDAVLELELEEDASAGHDDLPEIVKLAAAKFGSGNTAAEADSIEALARAMEEETKSNNAPPPAPSDIRSLMLRVEALAKKAEAMRQAQSEEDGGEETPKAEESATDTGDKKSGVAA